MISLSSFFADATADRMIHESVEPAGSVGAAVEELVEQCRCLGLRAGHQMAVEVERDLDRGMAKTESALR